MLRIQWDASFRCLLIRTKRCKFTQFPYWTICGRNNLAVNSSSRKLWHCISWRKNKTNFVVFCPSVDVFLHVWFVVQVLQRPKPKTQCKFSWCTAMSSLIETKSKPSNIRVNTSMTCKLPKASCSVWDDQRDGKKMIYIFQQPPLHDAPKESPLIAWAISMKTSAIA